MPSTLGSKPSCIAPRYRLALVGRFAGVAWLGFVLFGLALLVLLNKRLGVGYREDLTTLSRLQEHLPVVLAVAGAIQVAVMGLVLLILSLFWAHAVSGPLVRVRRYLRMIASGELIAELAFRDTDQLHALADAFTRLSAASQQRREAFGALLAQAEHLIRECDRLRTDHLADATQLREQQAALQRVYQGMRRLLPGGETG